MLSVAKNAKARMPQRDIKPRVQPTRHLRVILSLRCPLGKPPAGIPSVGLGTASQERLEQIIGVRRDLQNVKDMKRDWPKEEKTERGCSRQVRKWPLSRGNKRICSLCAY